MSRCREAIQAIIATALLGAAWGCAAQTIKPKAVAHPDYLGLGRTATPREIAAWDIDVRADFKGLPAGSGSVAQGQVVWEAQCASCHGVFGESNSVFNPLVGGTTADDIKTGRVARLLDPAYPGRTTLMKLASVSTLWDYINRAMPWTNPKSLTTDEVYAVTAFLLNLGDVVPDDFTLSDRNIREVQARLPNRNGMTTGHTLWPGPLPGDPGKRAAGVHTAVPACMKNCAVEAGTLAIFPDAAWVTFGNQAEQTHTRGRSVANSAQASLAGATTAAALASQHGCTACHGMTQKIVGPAFADIASKYGGQVDYLIGKIKSGGSGVWGSIPMPAQTVNAPDTRTLAAWLAAGAP